MNQAGALTKSTSVFSSTTVGPVIQYPNGVQARFVRHASPNQSPMLNGYSHFSKIQVPQFSSSFIKPPHMQDPAYLAHHATKPATENKFIAMNDLEEGVKLAVLSDVERDQRMLSKKR